VGTLLLSAAGPAGERRRRLRPRWDDERSGFAAEAADAGSAGVSITGAAASEGVFCPFPPAGLRRLRLRAVAAAGAAPATSWSRSGAFAPAWRVTLAPTSPSAQSTPSAVRMSTRQTTIEVGVPATGGRFWVRVQRAWIVSPACTGRGNFQLSQSHSATEGTGMSIEPRPSAIATSRAGGTTRAPPGRASIVSGEKSPATPANNAMSDSEMVRRRVVHAPPRGRSSKEIGSRSRVYRGGDCVPKARWGLRPRRRGGDRCPLREPTPLPATSGRRLAVERPGDGRSKSGLRPHLEFLEWERLAEQGLGLPR
jgi:hypothetical protein